MMWFGVFELYAPGLTTNGKTTTPQVIIGGIWHSYYIVVTIQFIVLDIPLMTIFTAYWAN